MNRKTLIAMVAGCLAILLLVCILLVGVLDGIWPWDGVEAYGRLITGRTQNTIGPKEETTAPTETTTGSGSQAGGQQQEPEKPTVGEVGQKPLPPTLPGEDDEIQNEVGGVVIGPSGSTEATGTTGGAVDSEDDGQLDASKIPGW